MGNSQRTTTHGREQKKESEEGHFMDSKENRLYYFIRLELLRLKNLTNIFGEGIKDYFQRT